MAVGPASSALAGVPAGWFTDRFGPRNTVALGLIQMTAGLAALALFPRVAGVTGYILALMLLTPGFQFFLAGNNTAVMNWADDQKRGAVSGLLGLSRNLGFVTGASVMASVFAGAVDTSVIAEANPDAIATGLTTTFLLGCGLVLLAFGIACRNSE